MVTATTTTSDAANIESMFIAGDSDGQGNYFESILNYDDLTASQQVTYMDAVNLFALDGNTTITNTNSELSVDRMTSLPTNYEATEVVDFLTMSAADQQKLRDFLALAVSEGTVG